MQNAEKVEIGYTLPKERWQEAAKNLEDLGNALAASEKDGVNTSAFLNDFVAPYSGTFYVSAGWVKSGDSASGVVIYGVKESVPAPGAVRWGQEACSK